MKASLCLFLFAVASSAFIIEDSNRCLGNTLDDLVIKALEYIRSLLKKHDPYTLPPLPDQHLVDTDTDLVISTSNVKVSNGGDFTIDKVQNDILNLRASFEITVPAAHISGNYKISGSAAKKTVEGSGTFVLDITKLVQSGSIQFGIVQHSLQITDLSLDYDIGSVQTNVEGLNIEGLTPAQVTDLLNTKFMAYLQANKPYVTEKVASHVKDIANKLTKGKSLKEVIEWLEQMVASTPDPSLFTF